MLSKKLVTFSEVLAGVGGGGLGLEWPPGARLFVPWGRRVVEGAIPGGQRAHAGQGGDAGANKLAGTVGLHRRGGCDCCPRCSTRVDHLVRAKLVGAGQHSKRFGKSPSFEPTGRRHVFNPN
jgi:hypothetical protein